MVDDGVPLIVPDEESMLRPVGSVGEILQRITSPPLTVGMDGFIGVSLVSDSELGE